MAPVKQPSTSAGKFASGLPLLLQSRVQYTMLTRVSVPNMISVAFVLSTPRRVYGR